MRRQRFPVMLSKEERLALKSLSDAEGGLSQAATVRRLIRKEAHRLSVWPPKERQAQSPGKGA